MNETNENNEKRDIFFFLLCFASLHFNLKNRFYLTKKIELNFFSLIFWLVKRTNDVSKGLYRIFIPLSVCVDTFFHFSCLNIKFSIFFKYIFLFFYKFFLKNNTGLFKKTTCVSKGGNSTKFILYFYFPITPRFYVICLRI